MTTLTDTKAREQLSEALKQVAHGGERIVIKRRGKVLAALVWEDDLALLESIEDQMDLKEAKRRLADPKARFIAFQQAREEMGLSILKSAARQKPVRSKTSKRMAK